MKTVGAYEAKTHLSQLLDRVSKGERICILRHGVPVATLQPVASSNQKPTRETIDELRQFRTRVRLDGLSLREMIEEGRR